MSKPGTVCELFDATVAAHGDEVALRTLGGESSLTWAEYGDRSRNLAAGLHTLGLRRGDTIGLMLANRPEFNLADTAAMLLGAVCFSVYATSSPEQVRRVLDDSGARIVVSEHQFLDRIIASGAEVDHLVLVNEVESVPAGGIQLSELEAAGRAAEIEVSALSDAVRPDDVLCLIYTSGTTGVSKGAQLTHANILAEAEMLRQVVPVRTGSRAVSFLPSAHIGDRFLTHYNGIACALEVTCCPSMLDLGAHLVDARPQFLPSVPRVWEKMKATIEASFAEEGDAERFRAAVERKDEQVLRRLRQRLGLDSLEYCLVGGAAGPREVLEFFAGIGVELLEVWGMTETTAVTTVNPPGAVRYGSVGKALPGIDLRIAADGELLVRGPSVTGGYRNMPEETAAALDGGWLATGDLAKIDDAGYVWIIDRKKDLIINAAGKNMSPTFIESTLKSSSPLIGEACVVGDARPFNTALIVLDPEGVASSAAAGERADLAQLATDPALVAEVEAGVSAANERLARVEQIKRWKVLPVEWAPGGDEMTLSMKLRRRAIAEKYEAEIEELYRPASPGRGGGG